MQNARPILIKFIGATAVFGVVFAMAATLNVNGQTLGAGDATVAACDGNGVTTSYSTVWDSTDERYEVSSVTVGGIAVACDGNAMKVTLVDSTGASLGEGTATVPTGLVADTSQSVTLSPQASAEGVEGVNVVIAD